MRPLERACAPATVLLITCLGICGCGGSKRVKPEAVAFEPTIVGTNEPTIVGCSTRPLDECSFVKSWETRELARARNHLCPEAKPKVLIKADGELVCVATLRSGGPTLFGASIPAAVRQSGAGAVAEFKAGESVAARTGCLACHRIAEVGNKGPGAELTHVGSRLPPRAIERALVASPAPMPSFSRLPADQRRALVYFLAQLR